MSQEILAPAPVADDGTRDRSGRFGDGNSFAKGRPAGVPNRITTQVREMIVEALESAGGVGYLTAMAYAQPQAFLALVGKTLPIKVDADIKNVEMVYIKHEFVSAPPARADRPRPPSPK